MLIKQVQLYFTLSEYRGRVGIAVPCTEATTLGLFGVFGVFCGKYKINLPGYSDRNAKVVSTRPLTEKFESIEDTNSNLR